MRKELEWICSKEPTLTDQDLESLLLDVWRHVEKFNRSNPDGAVTGFGTRSKPFIKFEKGVVEAIQDIDDEFEPTGDVPLTAPTRPRLPPTPGAATVVSTKDQGKPEAPAAAVPAAIGPAEGAQKKEEFPDFGGSAEEGKSPEAQPPDAPMEVDSTAAGGPAEGEPDEPEKKEEDKSGAAKAAAGDGDMEVDAGATGPAGGGPEDPEEGQKEAQLPFTDPDTVAPHDDRGSTLGPCMVEGFFTRSSPPVILITFERVTSIQPILSLALLILADGMRRSCSWRVNLRKPSSISPSNNQSGY